MTAPYYDKHEDQFWIPTDDGPLWFDSALEAKDAQRQLEIEAGRKAERDRIAAWLRDHKAFSHIGGAFMANAIEAGEHLK